MNLRPLAAMAVLYLATQAAIAAPGDDIATALSRCAALTDGQARLGCYDQLAAQVKTAAFAQPAAQAPLPADAKDKDESWFGISEWFGSSTAPERQTSPAQFGSEALPPPPAAPGAPPAPEPLESIGAGLSDYAYNPYGRFTAFLDNGQIWKQLEGDVGRAHFRKDDRITISRGALGSYNLEIAGHMGLYKVKRIK